MTNDHRGKSESLTNLETRHNTQNHTEIENQPRSLGAKFISSVSNISLVKFQISFNFCKYKSKVVRKARGRREGSAGVAAAERIILEGDYMAFRGDRKTMKGNFDPTDANDSLVIKFILKARVVG